MKSSSAGAAFSVPTPASESSWFCGLPGAEHCPARRRADGVVAIASRPGRPGRRRALTKRQLHRRRH
eukprot:580673-Pleurochrysis_carterae.AAC.3